MLQFCTISTASHLFKSYALADSLASYGFTLHILVVDEFTEKAAPSNVKFCHLSDKEHLDNYSAVVQKYKSHKDKLRWALKPVFLLDLLQQFDRLVYVDNDCFFFGSPLAVDQLLNEHQVLLTPHAYPSNPKKEQNWLEANFRVGLFNAGFIAVNKQAQEALTWWMHCCLYSLKKAYWRGLFDDQKYLDLLPIRFDGIHVLKHRGFNLAGWNDMNTEITYTADGWRVNGQQLIFVHFAALTLEKWAIPTHQAFELFETYRNALNKHHTGYQPSKGQLAYRISAYFYFLRWKLVRIFE